MVDVGGKHFTQKVFYSLIHARKMLIENTRLVDIANALGVREAALDRRISEMRKANWPDGLKL